MKSPLAGSGIFRGRECFLEYTFRVRHTKERSHRKKFGVVFFNLLLKLHRIGISSVDTNRALFSKTRAHFFAKLGHFFSIFKKEQARPLSSLPR